MSNWHTGIPTEFGDYLVKLNGNIYDVLNYNGTWWGMNINGKLAMISEMNIIKWQKIIDEDV